MRIYESQEDYLEKILMLAGEDGLGQVRSVDLARAMGVTNPSVSNAMRLLREKALIHMDDYGLITLSEEGRGIAERVLERHMTLARFFMSLGVEEKTAYEDACRIEHVISQQSFLAICQLSRSHCPVNAKERGQGDGKEGNEA